MSDHQQMTPSPFPETLLMSDNQLLWKFGAQHTEYHRSHEQNVTSSEQTTLGEIHHEKDWGLNNAKMKAHTKFEDENMSAIRTPTEEADF
jgi:hypothetical protein